MKASSSQNQQIEPDIAHEILAELAAIRAAIGTGQSARVRKRPSGQMSREACVLLIDALLEAAGSPAKKRVRAELIEALTGFSATGVTNIFSASDRHIELLRDAFESGEDAGPEADRFFRLSLEPAAAWLARIELENKFQKLTK